MKLILIAVVVVVAALAITAIAWAAGRPADPPTTAPAGIAGTFVGRTYEADGTLGPAHAMSTVRRTEAQWKQALTPEEYDVLRDHGTERAFTGDLVDNKAKGTYTCAGCGLPLFDSATKFESGTGWPSFFRPLTPENVGTREDRSLFMVRTEVHCARCNGHLGHVFDDGPPPTGKRYCLNSVALDFTPADELATLAEPRMNDDASTTGDAKLASAVFAGGCFWCVEAVFEEIDGVQDAVSGYAGGSADTANYKAVCSGRTGHAEAVRIDYDPSKVAYEDLLRVFFATHDPTQLNRQGNDVGTQYRSAIFYANDREKALAQAFIDDLTDQKVFDRPIVTTLEPLTAFYPAEAYHQNYVCNNPGQGYIRAVALPKVEKVRKEFKDKLKDVSPLEKAPH